MSQMLINNFQTDDNKLTTVQTQNKDKISPRSQKTLLKIPFHSNLENELQPSEVNITSQNLSLKSEEQFIKSDDSVVTPLQLRAGSQNSSKRSDGKERMGRRKNQHKKALIDVYYEFKSEEEDSQEDTSNLIVTNYDDWLEKKVRGDNQPSIRRSQKSEPPIDKKKTNLINFTQKQHIGQVNDPIEEINQNLRNKLNAARKSRTSAFGSRQNSEESDRNSRLSNQKSIIKDGGPLVLPVISVYEKSSQHNQTPRSQLGDIILEKLENPSPKITISNKIDALRLALAKENNTPKRLLNREDNSPMPIRNSQKTPERSRSINRDATKSSINRDQYYLPQSLRFEETRNSNYDQKVLYDPTQSITPRRQALLNKSTDRIDELRKSQNESPGPGKYYVERNVNIALSGNKSRQYSYQDGQKINILDLEETEQQQNPFETELPLQIKNVLKSNVITGFDNKRNTTNFIESETHPVSRRFKSEIQEPDRFLTKSQNRKQQIDNFYVQSPKADEVQVLNLEDAELSSQDKESVGKKYLTPDVRIRKLNQKNAGKIFSQSLNKPKIIQDALNEIKTKKIKERKNSQIVQIERRLAALKVKNALKSVVSMQSQFQSVLNVNKVTIDLLKELLKRLCFKELNSRRVTDDEIEHFIQDLGYNDGVITLDIQNISNQIYGESTPFVINQEQESDDEKLIGKKETGQMAVNKKQRNKVDFEPDQATNSQRKIPTKKDLFEIYQIPDTQEELTNQIIIRNTSVKSEQTKSISEKIVQKEEEIIFAEPEQDQQRIKDFDQTFGDLDQMKVQGKKTKVAKPPVVLQTLKSQKSFQHEDVQTYNNALLKSTTEQIQNNILSAETLKQNSKRFTIKMSDIQPADQKKEWEVKKIIVLEKKSDQIKSTQQRPQSQTVNSKPVVKTNKNLIVIEAKNIQKIDYNKVEMVRTQTNFMPNPEKDDPYNPIFSDHEKSVKTSNSKDKTKVLDLNRLYKTETIASQLKRNERLLFEAKQKENKKQKRSKLNSSSVKSQKLSESSEQNSDLDEQNEEPFSKEYFSYPITKLIDKQISSPLPCRPMASLPILNNFKEPAPLQLHFYQFIDKQHQIPQKCSPLEPIPINQIVELKCERIPSCEYSDQQIKQPTADCPIWFPIIEQNNEENKPPQIQYLHESQIEIQKSQEPMAWFPLWEGISPEPMQELIKIHDWTQNDFAQMINSDRIQWKDSFVVQQKMETVNESEEDKIAGNLLNTLSDSSLELVRKLTDSSQEEIIENQQPQFESQRYIEKGIQIQQKQEKKNKKNHSDKSMEQSDSSLNKTSNKSIQIEKDDEDKKQKLFEYFNKLESKPDENPRKSKSTKMEKLKLNRLRAQGMIPFPIKVDPVQKPENRQSNGCQADFFDDKNCSDIDDVYESAKAIKPNMRDAGIQTSNIHFKKVTATDNFKAKQEDKAFSTDWTLSGIYDELQFKKQGVHKHTETENCGNQVEELQIQNEHVLHILSQIECEYNAEMLKHKQVSSGEKTSIERCQQLYVLGLNTLQALMFILRLQKEWETVTKPQYHIVTDFQYSFNSKFLQVDEAQCIKLLLRCKKMYEAKQSVMHILKITIQKDQLVKKLKKGKLDAQEYQTQLKIIQKLGQKITSSVNNLQDEHRIMKRPFIIRSNDYLIEIMKERQQLDGFFKQNYFIDEAGTVGHKY